MASFKTGFRAVTVASFKTGLGGVAMASFKTGFRGVTVAAVLVCCGCSWFHRKDAAAAPAAPVTDAAAQLEAKPEALSPDAEALRAASLLASDFYEMRQRLGQSGLPDEGEMKAYRAFVCPALATAMDAARARQKAYMAQHPDDKPPLVEGDLFSSLFEGPDSAVATATEVDGAGARVTMSMRLGEGDEATRWKDTVLLSREDGIWCIADVSYGGEWPFANKGRLSESLAAPF
jgi:hypothetical protein